MFTLRFVLGMLFSTMFAAAYVLRYGTTFDPMPLGIVVVSIVFGYLLTSAVYDMRHWSWVGPALKHGPWQLQVHLTQILVGAAYGLTIPRPELVNNGSSMVAFVLGAFAVLGGTLFAWRVSAYARHYIPFAVFATFGFTAVASISLNPEQATLFCSFVFIALLIGAFTFALPAHLKLLRAVWHDFWFQFAYWKKARRRTWFGGFVVRFIRLEFL